MFNCDCGKAYKFASGLSKHKERCGGGGGGGGKTVTTSHCPPPSVVVDNVAGGGGGGGRISDDDGDDDDITKSSFFTFPLTQLKPTANFSKEDLEMLEKRKQARLKAIQQSRIEEKQRNAAAAERKKREALISTSAGLYENSSSSSHFQENIGNEEHNASINIKYVRTSQETRQVIDAVAAAANEYCHNQGLGRNNHNSSMIEKDNKSSIEDDGDDYGSAGGGGGGEALAPATSVNSSGTTVFHHPSRTISIIEKDAGDDDMDESERIVTLEKMTYLVLALIQQNTKIQKENALLKAIISKIDPSKLE
jgi:hypothetical protein